jgi:hypothetical protein
VSEGYEMDEVKFSGLLTGWVLEEYSPETAWGELRFILNQRDVTMVEEFIMDGLRSNDYTDAPVTVTLTRVKNN